MHPPPIRIYDKSNFSPLETMKRTVISDSITYIEPTDIHPSFSCAALVISSSPKIVIDLNLSDSDTETVLNELQPDRAYITHYHLDHSRFWPAVEKFSSAAFYIPAGEEMMLSDRDSFLETTPGKHGSRDAWLGFLKMSGFRPIQKYRTYDGNHRISSGNSTIECIRTAGHSPSHTSFFLPAERVLFAGDLGFNRFGPWYGWMSCSIPDYIESLLTLRSLPVETLLTSHEGVIRSGIDKAWDDCLAHFFIRERNIRKQLDTGETTDSIVAKGIYFTNKDRVEEPMKTVITIWDQIMLDHHMEILEKGSLEAQYPDLFNKVMKEE